MCVLCCELAVSSNNWTCLSLDLIRCSNDKMTQLCRIVNSLSPFAEDTEGRCKYVNPQRTVRVVATAAGVLLYECDDTGRARLVSELKVTNIGTFVRLCWFL